MGNVVYVVDPDARESQWIESVLSPLVEVVRGLDSAESLLALLGARDGACLVVSTDPDEAATLEFVRELRTSGSMIPVIAIGSEATLRTATEFARCTATDFLKRPLSAFHLRAAVLRACEARPTMDPLSNGSA
jgi:DNA-binding NtrC family response regulator